MATAGRGMAAWAATAAGVALLCRLLAGREGPLRRLLPGRLRRPAPPLHVVLPEASTRGRRVILVGDIHGCYDELRSLLDLCLYRPGVDILISVGDLVNKGPATDKVLAFFRDGGPTVLAVAGNHDDGAAAAWQALRAGRPLPRPERHAWLRGLDPSLGRLLGELPLSVRLPALGVAVVHAGLVPGVPLERQTRADLTTMRDVVPAELAEAAASSSSSSAVNGYGGSGSGGGGGYDWGAALAALQVAAAQGPAESKGEGARPAGVQAPALPRLVASERRSPLGRAWASVWQGPDHVFFGHDAKRRLQLERRATGLDGGCCYGGRLLAAVLPPLDEAGRPLLERANVPPGAQPIQLGTGLAAFLVGVDSRQPAPEAAAAAAAAEQGAAAAAAAEAG